VIAYAAADPAVITVMQCRDAVCRRQEQLAFANVDTGGTVGGWVTVAIGRDGNPLIAFNDSKGNDLRVLHCGDPACAGPAASTIVDSRGDVGFAASIASGPDTFALISYFDASRQDLKVLRCGNNSCDQGNVSVAADTDGEVGQGTAMAIRQDGLGVVSYFDANQDDLRVLHCGNPGCTAGNTVTAVHTAGSVGAWTSMAIGADGLAVVSYFDATNQQLKVLHCGSVLCNNTGGQ
jgi:hypothetical protein